MKCILIVALVLCAPMLAIGCGCGGSSSKDNATKTVSTTDIWTCSMHPDVQAKQAGACPTCGMDLIQKTTAVSSSAGAGGQPWTCSMHPRVMLPESGKCPICNMALVQTTAGKPGEATAIATATAQTTCPLMGGKIDKKHFADHDGKRVYFCCPGCQAPFKKDPAKYIKKLEDKGVTLDKTPVAHQTMCPIMNKPIKKDLYVDHDGKRVYVCCKMCVRRVKGDPGKYIKKLEGEGITLETTPAPGE